MIEPTIIPTSCLDSAHFKLVVDFNAFGRTLKISQHDYSSLLLLQTTNDWYRKQWDQSQEDNNHRALLLMLEAAYEKGRHDALSEIKKALGIHV
jgi:hypothetical protein